MTNHVAHVSACVSWVHVNISEKQELRVSRLGGRNFYGSCKQIYAWRCTPVIPIRGKLKPEDHELKTSPSFLSRSCVRI